MDDELDFAQVPVRAKVPVKDGRSQNVSVFVSFTDVSFRNSWWKHRSERILFRMPTMYFTLWKKLPNTRLRMIAGPYIRERYMILQSMPRSTLEAERSSSAKVKIAHSYTTSITHGSTPSTSLASIKSEF